MTSGKATMAILADMTACSNGSVGYAIQHAHAGITDVNFTVPTNGTYKFNAQWNGSFTFVYNLSAGASSSNGTFYSEYFLLPIDCLFDRTSHYGGCDSAVGAVAQGVYTTGNGSAPANGRVQMNFSDYVHYHDNGLVSGHQYYLRLYLLAFVQVGDFGGLTTGSARAAFSMAGSGGSAHLLAIRVYQ
ncbi:MAG: hypothetical protein L3K17_09675 [Thermoplasmata archaeon]|nr:hypothetical protein [Thermoplasmata archaeon]